MEIKKISRWPLVIMTTPTTDLTDFKTLLTIKRHGKFYDIPVCDMFGTKAGQERTGKLFVEKVLRYFKFYQDSPPLERQGFISPLTKESNILQKPIFVTDAQ